MPMRLQEIHPSIVHYPLALAPLAIAADLIGVITGRRSALRMGKRLMPIAAASAAAAGVTGLVAQEVVKLQGPASDLLKTHRTLNMGGLIALTALAAVRSRSLAPSPAVLALGLATVATMAYSAYLGGRMVYEHGVGVRAADGLHEETAPELTIADAPSAARQGAAHVVEGVRHAAQQMREGDLVPALTRRSSAGGSA